MHSSAPLDRHAAREFIEEVARRKGTFTEDFMKEAEREAALGRKGMLQAIEGREENREDLSKILDIVSRDLYTSCARFLMEIIQNADDNEYGSLTMPMVSISVFPKYVKIECNETGFSKDNIQAICRTGRSSKKPGQGYTGEKGIGFKSVFKIANRAHIRSHPFYFQLDSKRDLGMITPQWDEEFFADHSSEHQTTIILDHASDSSRDFATVLENDINAIDPTLLLFLRRVERLHLTLEPKGFGLGTEMKFRRETGLHGPGVVSLIDEEDNSKTFFYKHPHTVMFFGTENRRPSINITEVVLAFPLRFENDTYVPSVQCRNFVFAYLPLGDFGLKFIIQADFLTISNRESIDEDSPWNQNIASAIPSAFLAAVNKFNSTSGQKSLKEMALRWPLYLEHQCRTTEGFWHKIAQSVTRTLSGAMIVKTIANDMGMPKSLMFLDWAHDRNGKPMFGRPQDYVSLDYPIDVRNALLSLGVKKPTWSWLCNEIRKLQINGTLQVKLRSEEWSSDLAKMIMDVPGLRNFGGTAYDLWDVALIPLSNGLWRNPPTASDPVYFPAVASVTIPPGLTLPLVDKNACACPQRRKLFEFLGVEECGVSNVVKQILNYHTKTNMIFATRHHVTEHLKYLYRMRNRLSPGDVRKIYLSTSYNGFLKGTFAYADSSGNTLRTLLSGCNTANFLDEQYFKDFVCPAERDMFTDWLASEAGVATIPRLIANSSDQMHNDFEWLIRHKTGEVLEILHKHWPHYKRQLTKSVTSTLTNHAFPCITGGHSTLSKTYLPSRTLLKEAQAFVDSTQCNFLLLVSGEPQDWDFLQRFGVGVKEDLDFYLWILNQPGFVSSTDSVKAKGLYQKIQDSCFTPNDMQKVKINFHSRRIKLPHGNYESVQNCVWHAPKGFSIKPVLHLAYGDDLARLFRDILSVPNATGAEAMQHLQSLRSYPFTTMEDVLDVYTYISDFAPSVRIDRETVCIAIPTSVYRLEWKKPSSCVWTDDEFSQIGLKLECRTVLSRAMGEYAPKARPFLIWTLGLKDAGINELLLDLKLMATQCRNEFERACKLYEKIACHRHSSLALIKSAFREAPLVFLRTHSTQEGQWLRLQDCIWMRSVLQNKHSLQPSLEQYRALFRDALEVPNATIQMLVVELSCRTLLGTGIDETRQRYVKDLILEIARMQRNGTGLDGLNGLSCWPCRTPAGNPQFCSLGNFYVNDRQDLFEIFSTSHTFLDFDFQESKRVADLLRNQGCDQFLSQQATIKSVPLAPLKYDEALTLNYRNRADALTRYFESAGCKSIPNTRTLLENVKVWTTPEIQTRYKLGESLKSLNDGGSAVQISTYFGSSSTLNIYMISNEHVRGVAVLVDFPGQLMAALQIDRSRLPDLGTFLQVPIASLKSLLIRKGIVGGDASDVLSVTVPVKPNTNSSNDTARVLDIPIRTGVLQANSIASQPVAPENSESIIISKNSEVKIAASRQSTNSNPTLRPASVGPSSRPDLDISDNSPVRGDTGTARPSMSGIYTEENRQRNRERVQNSARKLQLVPRAVHEEQSIKPRRHSDPYDMTALRRTLTMAAESGPSSNVVRSNIHPNQRVKLSLQRSEEDVARDFEVGFLGEQFVYTLLHETLKLPQFTGEENWTSSLRSRAGFSHYDQPEKSDFIYRDAEGALTRHILQMAHPYTLPKWLSTACDTGNAPVYRIEVKSTTCTDPSTTFYMSSNQYKMAKSLQVTSATPTEIYVVVRVSGLGALEDGSDLSPQCRFYLDPYTLGQTSVLEYVAPTYAVTASV